MPKLSSDSLPSLKPILQHLILSPGASSAKDPISSQSWNQFTTLPATFATPYSPYQSFAELARFPVQAQEMHVLPSSYQGQYNQAMELGISDQQEQYNSLVANYLIQLPYSASILPDPVHSGYMLLERDTKQPVCCMHCGAVQDVFGRCQNHCTAIAAKVLRSKITAAFPTQIMF